MDLGRTVRRMYAASAMLLVSCGGGGDSGNGSCSTNPTGPGCTQPKASVSLDSVRVPVANYQGTPATVQVFLTPKNCSPNTVITYKGQTTNGTTATFNRDRDAQGSIDITCADASINRTLIIPVHAAPILTAKTISGDEGTPVEINLSTIVTGQYERATIGTPSDNNFTADIQGNKITITPKTRETNGNVKVPLIIEAGTDKITSELEGKFRPMVDIAYAVTDGRTNARILGITRWQIDGKDYVSTNGVIVARVPEGVVLDHGVPRNADSWAFGIIYNERNHVMEAAWKQNPTAKLAYTKDMTTPQRLELWGLENGPFKASQRAIYDDAFIVPGAFWQPRPNLPGSSRAGPATTTPDQQAVTVAILRKNDAITGCMDMLSNDLTYTRQLTAWTKKQYEYVSSDSLKNYFINLAEVDVLPGDFVVSAALNKGYDTQFVCAVPRGVISGGATDVTYIDEITGRRKGSFVKLLSADGDINLGQGFSDISNFHGGVWDEWANPGTLHGDFYFSSGNHYFGLPNVDLNALDGDLERMNKHVFRPAQRLFLNLPYKQAGKAFLLQQWMPAELDTILPK